MDGRPNRRNKAALSKFSGIVWTLPLRQSNAQVVFARLPYRPVLLLFFFAFIRPATSLQSLLVLGCLCIPVNSETTSLSFLRAPPLLRSLFLKQFSACRRQHRTIAAYNEYSSTTEPMRPPELQSLKHVFNHLVFDHLVLKYLHRLPNNER